jgi:hypothetical protein
LFVCLLVGLFTVGMRGAARGAVREREEVVEGQGFLPKWHKRITQGQKIKEEANNNKEQQQHPFYPFEGSARDFSFFVCLKITPAAALEPWCCKTDASSTQHRRVQREQLESQAQPASPSHYITLHRSRGEDVYVHNLP